MARTMLENYKMGLMSYDELLKNTADIFISDFKWYSVIQESIEEVVDYLGKDLIDYMKQHDNYKNYVMLSCNLYAIPELLHTTPYEFKLTPAGYETITVTYDSVSSEWFVANKFDHYLLKDDIKHEMYFKILALKEAYQVPVIMTVRTNEKYLHFLCY